MAWLGSPRTARIYRAQNSRDLDTNKTPILRVPGFSSCRDMCVHTSGRSLAYALWLCCALLLSSCPLAGGYTSGRRAGGGAGAQAHFPGEPEGEEAGRVAATHC